MLWRIHCIYLYVLDVMSILNPIWKTVLFSCSGKHITIISNHFDIDKISKYSTEGSLVPIISYVATISTLPSEVSDGFKWSILLIDENLKQKKYSYWLIFIISIYHSQCMQVFLFPRKDNPLVYEVENWNFADLHKGHSN